MSKVEVKYKKRGRPSKKTAASKNILEHFLNRPDVIAAHAEAVRSLMIENMIFGSISQERYEEITQHAFKKIK